MQQNGNHQPNPWQDKRVLVTGVCGTVGRELFTQIRTMAPEFILGLDNNESELFFIDDEFRNDPVVRFQLGDMRDRDKLTQAMQGVDIVLHTAALKHVILCEQSPQDAIQTNIQGVQNIIDAANANGVERVIFTSSDKAVNPTNVMGTSKLMGERLMTAANAHRRAGGPIFSSTRFGNVLGSRGSVIPIFQRQIERGGPVTLTDTRMTRFIMTLSEAVRLVMESTFLAQGGEVFVTKMPVVRIEDLARVMLRELAPQHGFDPAGIGIDVIGSKPGEKLYEELMNDEETRRTVELQDYFVVLPAFQALYETIDYNYPTVVADRIDDPYNSATRPAMSQDEVRAFLIRHQLLQEGEACVS